MDCPECGVRVVEEQRCPACGHDLADDGRWSATRAEQRGRPATNPADLPGLRRFSTVSLGYAAALVAVAAGSMLPVVPVDPALALGVATPAAALLTAATLLSAGLVVRTGARLALYGATLLHAALLGLASAALAPVGVVAFLASTVAAVAAVRERRTGARPN